MADETNTPQDTLNHATQADMLPRRGLVLLGTFVKTEGSQALVRLPSGKIQSIAEGDKVGGANVTAIKHGAIILARKGSASRLEMPQG